MLNDFLDKEVVYVGIGSNTGDRIASIKESIGLLKRMSRIEIVDISSLYETEPVDVATTDWFINCVLKIETDLACFELFFILKEIEQTMGRVKDRVNGSRTIDLDLLVWENRVLGSDTLTIPHHELHNRRFALEPLKEINPGLKIPRLNKTPGELIEALQGKYRTYAVKKVVDRDELKNLTAHA
ncbi:MAG TPA: 2-amino-4-hydroxy-6-hydroxymethyldihydropteridine diphosphokinase [bacterium]|nr:2-amino-4-hydroxy-6-hydroxymethyldihydropteridine diphosphokinase [bacterium]